jgi:DNA sulfur modification protein DndB
MGVAGHALLHQHPQDWQTCLSPLRDVNWSRSNAAVWEGRAMLGGQMSKARQNVQLTANLLKTTLGLTLTPEENKLEGRYKQGASGHYSSSK